MSIPLPPLRPGLTPAASIAELRQALQQRPAARTVCKTSLQQQLRLAPRISSHQHVTLLAAAGAAYTPLADDDVLGGLFEDVEVHSLIS